jgi:hypothetical protein
MANFQILPRPNVQEVIDEFIGKKFGKLKERKFDSAWQLTKTPDGKEDYRVSDDFGGLEAPKLKFLFTIEFELNEQYKIDAIKNYINESNADSLKDCMFALKSASRPNATIEYQDVNYYNYRTKVATKMDFGKITISFYDDSSNKAQRLMALYTNAVSPISNAYQAIGAAVEASNAAGAALNPISQSTTIPAASNDIDTYHPNLRATIGPLLNRFGVFKRIRISQWFLTNSLSLGNDVATANEPALTELTTNSESAPTIDLTQPLTTNSAAITTSDKPTSTQVYARINYDFINPKIENYEFDELDMAASEVSMINATFNCDVFTMSYDKVTDIQYDPTSKKKKKSTFEKIIEDELLAFKNIPQQVLDVGLEKGINKVLKGFP